MSDFDTEIGIGAEIVPERLIPVGEILLGQVDPKSLTRTEFSQAPGRLFHGSVDTTFRRNYDYEAKNYSSRFSSETAGRGYYTTDNRESAEFYSMLRLEDKGEPAVVELLPFQAKMYDFRATKDTKQNAPVENELFIRYRAYVQTVHAGKYPDGVIPVATVLPRDAHTDNMMEEFFAATALPVGTTLPNLHYI